MPKKNKSRSLVGFTAVSLSILFLIQIVLGTLAAQQGLDTIFLPIISKPPLPPEQWVAAFGAAEMEMGKSAFVTSDGSIILAVEQGISCCSNQLLLIKLTNEGDVVWQKTISEPNDYTDIRNISVLESYDGAYVAAGLKHFSSGYDAWVTKLSYDGSLVWQYQYGGGFLDYVEDIKETADHGFILAGYTASGGSGLSSGLWVIKLQENGQVSWQKTYQHLLNDYGMAIEPTNDGGYIVVGHSGAYSNSGDYLTELWLLRLNGEGSAIWQKSFGGVNNEYGANVHQTADGGFIVAGSTSSFGAGGSDAWILKLDGAGTVIWQKTYGGIGNDEATDIQKVDGRYLVSGYTESFGAGGQDGWLLMLNVDGTIAWQKTYGGPDNDSLNSINLISEGGYLLTGATESYGGGESDAWLMKLDANGDVAECDLIGNSYAIVMDTAVVGGDTSSIPQISSATPVASTAVSQDSSVEKTQQCVAP